MIENKNQIGMKIKLARIEAGLTQIELARKINYDRQVIIRIEAGKRTPNINDLKKIAEATNQSLPFFLEEKKPEEKLSTKSMEDYIYIGELTNEQKEHIKNLIELFRKAKDDPKNELKENTIS